MLPEFLAGSYQRYKNDTNVFTTWLSKTAAASGFKVASTTNPNGKAPNPPAHDNTSPLTLAEKLRAQAEKKAKKKEAKKNAANSSQPREEEHDLETVRHVITTQDLLRQAKAVSRNAKVKIPDAIVQVLERTIQARRRCALWFQKTGLEKESTEGHLHFVGILEKALHILKPDYEPRDVAQSQYQASKKETPEPGIAQDLSGLSNRFSNLEVEDTDDIAETAATIQSLSSSSKAMPKNTSKKPNASIDVFELDYDETFDRLFGVFCFFEDLHRIQDFLTDTWNKFKNNELDLITASVTTNVAFDLACREEQELTRNIFKSEKLDYTEMASVIFFLDSLRAHSDAPEDSLRISPFDNFIFLPTARSVYKFAKCLELKYQYPQPVPPARMSYVFNQDMLILPEIRRMEREDEFISQYLMETSMLTMLNMVLKLQEALGSSDLPAAAFLHQYETQETSCDDEFTRGFERMRVRGEVSTSFVFACRILIDVQEILGEKVKQGWAMLKETAHFSRENLQVKKDLLARRGIMDFDGPRWKKNLGEASVIWIWKECNRYQRELPAAATNTTMSYELVSRNQSGEEVAAPPEVSQMAKRLNPQPIQPSQEQSFVYTRNPIICGLKLFEISLHYELAGTHLEGHHHTIFNTAHLYNAAAQLGLVKNRWPEIDHFIETHIGPLFAGRLPDNKLDFQTRYMLQVGLSPSARAKSTRTKKKHLSFSEAFRSGMEEGPQFPVVKATDVFRGYFDKTKSIEKCLYELEALIAEDNSKPLVSTSISKSLSKFQTSRRQLTPIELLSHVRTQLSSSVQKMRIDYISLVRVCKSLLEEIKSQLRVWYRDESGSHLPRWLSSDENEISPVTGQMESADASLGIIPFDVFEEEAEVHAFSEEFLRKEIRLMGPLPAGPKLGIVADVLRKFIDGERSSGSGENKEASVDRNDGGI